jgi:alpha-ketoglutarate-dependent taurine dioxygenase
MRAEHSKSLGIKRPGGQRRAVVLSQEELVTMRPIGERGLPYLVEPAVSGVDLVSWAEGHRDEIDRLLLEHRGLLFRGFDVESPEAFNAFVQASSSGDLLQYKDRSTPRHAVTGRVYVSTIYPPDQSIRLHNEGTYWYAWPLKIYFCCIVAPAERGATPICDVREVYDRIDPAVREELERRKIMYVRNYNQGVGLTWQEVYQTEDRKEVEEYCHANRIELEWLEDGRLRTRQIRPAVRRHPVTGDKLWFNHGAFFHISSQEPTVREELLTSYGEENLPYATYFGDGRRIPDAAVANIRDAYEQAKIVFPWKRGDVLLLDNMTVAHGREPYSGARQIVVAMVDAAVEEAA